MTLSELIAALHRDLDEIHLTHPDGEPLERSEKLAHMRLAFPVLAEDLWKTPPTDPVAIFEKERRIVHEYRRKMLFDRMEQALTTKAQSEPKGAA
jgi:hypothetical protein